MEGKRWDYLDLSAALIYHDNPSLAPLAEKKHYLLPVPWTYQKPCSSLITQFMIATNYDRNISESILIATPNQLMRIISSRLREKSVFTQHRSCCYLPYDQLIFKKESKAERIQLLLQKFDNSLIMWSNNGIDKVFAFVPLLKRNSTSCVIWLLLNAQAQFFMLFH